MSDEKILDYGIAVKYYGFYNKSHENIDTSTGYTIAGNHLTLLTLTSEHTAREIAQKARKVIGMLKRGIKFTCTQHYVVLQDILAKDTINL